MTHAADVVILGGGAVGLSIAYALSQEGLRTTVLDNARHAPQASWAGAGILAPASERPTSDPDAQLRTLSARLHADWSARLREETHLDNGYRRCGGLEVAADETAMWRLDDRAAAWSIQGITHQRLDSNGLIRREPILRRDLVGGYFIPGRAQIRNPWHLRALRVACERRQVLIESDTPALEIGIQSGRATSVRTSRETIPCGALVVAAGSWSESLLGSIGLTVPTPPVKGQIVLLRTRPGALSHLVEQGVRYLVPREDGRILVGATEESAGFDTRSTAAAVAGLIEFASRLCPTLSQAAVERTWAGLRPGNRDGRPSIGLAPGFENLVVATGHRRAGLQLSPGTALLVADLLTGRAPRIALDVFRPGRPPGPPPRDLFHS
jgi:glycine oxidase